MTQNQHSTRTWIIAAIVSLASCSPDSGAESAFVISERGRLANWPNLLTVDMIAALKNTDPQRAVELAIEVAGLQARAANLRVRAQKLTRPVLTKAERHRLRAATNNKS